MRDDASARRWRAIRERGQIDAGLRDRRGVRRGQAQVEANADYRVARPLRFTAKLHQDSAELGAARDKIIWPFEPYLANAAVFQRRDERNADRQTQARERCHAAIETFQQRQGNAAAERRLPCASAAATTVALHLRHAHEAIARIAC